MPKVKFHRLECLRGAAAFYVLLHHISSSYLHLQKTPVGTLLRFGQEAVVVFFVLSGFVIAYSMESGRAQSWRVYVLKRARRIYPIFIFSLLLAWLFPVVESGFVNPPQPWWLLGNLAMLQDIASKPGVWLEPLYGNSPLWSLSYEWLYYMLFFPLRKVLPRLFQKWAVLGLSVCGVLMGRLLANPFANMLALFPVWWAGVELADSYLKNGKVIAKDLSSQLLVMLVPLSMFLVIAFFERQAGKSLSLITYPVVQLRMLGDVLVLGAIFFAWRGIDFKGYDAVFSVFGRVAPISYALYVVHYTIIGGLRLLGGAESLFYVDLVLRVLLVFVVSWFLEKPVQGWINRRTTCLLNR